MRPFYQQNNAKLQKNSKMKSSHSSSESQSHSQSSKRQTVKNGTKQINNNKLLNNQQCAYGSQQTQSREEYFNRQKNNVVKKQINRKTDDYCTLIQSQSNPNTNSITRHTIDKNVLEFDKNLQVQSDVINKLKFTLPRGVIGFDGNIISVEPGNTKRPILMNNSIQHHTEAIYIPQSQLSRAKIKKAKSKSQPKTNKNLKRKSTSKTKVDNLLQFQNYKQSPKFNIESRQCTKILCQTTSTTETEISFDNMRNYPLELEEIKRQIKEKRGQKKFISNYLKKIKNSIRVQYINFISRLCFEAKLSKDIFYLTIYLIDTYLNDQILISKHKVLATAAFFLVVKLEDRSMSKILNQQLFRNQNKLIQELVNEQKGREKERNEKTEKKVMNNKKVEKKQLNLRQQNQKKKYEQFMAYVNLTISQMDQILRQELKTLPSAQDIIQFQMLLLIKEEFKIRKYHLGYWIDLLTLSWDKFLYNCQSKRINEEKSKKLFFRYKQHPQNYFYLNQVAQACLSNIQVYSYSPLDLVLAAIYLISRVGMSYSVRSVSIQEKNKNQCQTFDEYRLAMQKSNNCLFIDRYGINEIFGEFLESFDMQIGDILNVCKFVSNYLNTQYLQQVTYSQLKKYEINRMYVFNQHFWNRKLLLSLTKTQ